MNPDLAMGEDLLKKTGAAICSWVFGEPDIDVRHVPGTSYAMGGVGDDDRGATP